MQGRKRLREEGCGSLEEKMALWPILNEIWKSKMAVPVGLLEFRSACYNV